MPLVILIMLFAAAWFAPQPDFFHDQPRDLPWTLPDYKEAKTEFHILEDGRLAITIEHLPLPGVTPEMLIWFYRVLPISTVRINDREYPLYHLFHPSEHGRISVVEPAVDGSQGMGVGALVKRREWFGPYNSKGSGRVLKFGSEGMTVAPEVGGFKVGTIEHRFEPGTCGARYTVTSVLGSEMPVLGTLINLYIRHKQFPAKKIEQWLRHQVQEVSSLPFFLPGLYQRRASKAVAAQYTLGVGDIERAPGCFSAVESTLDFQKQVTPSAKIAGA